MLVGAILGGIAGYFIPEFMLSVSVIGQLFLNLLKIITIPLIISVIIVGIASLGDTHKIGRTTVASILYFLCTSTIAIIVGIILVSLIKPGLGIATSETIMRTFVPDVVPYAKSFNFADIFKAFIPSNIIGSTTGGQYLGIIILSLIFGTVMATMGRKAKVVLDFFNVITEVCLKAVYGILFIAPIGLFFLVGSAIAKNPESIFGINVGFLIITLLVGFVIHALIILPLILKIFGDKSPLSYVGKMSSALMTALGTSSSTATMPVTYSCVVEKNHVDSRAGSLVIPLGSFVNLNGTAMFLAITTIFACQMFGVSLSLLNIILVGLISLVLSFCSAGVPGSSIFMMAILFSVVNLPNEAYAALGLLVAVDWLFDRGRTVLNVWGNAVGAAVIGEMFDFKTVSKSKSVASPRKYDRSYDKKSSYKKDKPVRQDRKYADKKTKETRKPAVKKKDKIDSKKAKPKPTKVKKQAKPVHQDKTVNQAKPVTQTKPVVEIKKDDIKSPKRQTSVLRPPTIPKTPKRKPITTEQAKPDVNNEMDFSNNLSNKTIERERAKIAAQLALMKSKGNSHSSVKEDAQSKIDSENKEFDNKELLEPTIDFYSDDETVENEKPIEEKETFFENNNIMEKVNNITIPDSLGESVIEEESELETEPIEIPKEDTIESVIIEKENIKAIEVPAVPLVPKVPEVLKEPEVKPAPVIDNESEPEDEVKEIPEPAIDEEPESEVKEIPDSVIDKEPEPEEAQEPQFGRTKIRKGGVKRPDSGKDDKSNKTPTPTTSSVEILEDEKELSFGRTKKKRVRR